MTDFTSNSNLRYFLVDSNHFTCRLCSFDHPEHIIPEMILLCTFWDSNVSIASRLVPGTFIIIKNLFSKSDNQGRFIEANLHGDRMYPNRILVCAIHDTSHPSIQEIIQREKKILAKQLPPTIVLENELKKSSIREILACNIIPNKFKCVVKVVNHLPHDMRQFSRPFCTRCNAR